MKLADYARLQGLTYRAAWNQHKAGTLGAASRQLPTGTIIVDLPTKPEKVIIYARVSSHDQKKDLVGQVGRCIKHIKRLKLSADDVVTEIGSGMNGRRRKLLRILADPDVTHIVVEHRDRFMRFGSEFVEASLSSAGKKLIIVDDSELDDDLVQDMVSVLTSFCARLYGKRSAKNRAKKMLEAGNDC